MTHHTAVLTRLVTRLDQVLNMNVMMALSWWEMTIESASKLATGVEKSQYAKVMIFPLYSYYYHRGCLCINMCQF